MLIKAYAIMSAEASRERLPERRELVDVAMSRYLPVQAGSGAMVYTSRYRDVGMSAWLVVVL